MAEIPFSLAFWPLTSQNPKFLCYQVYILLDSFRQASKTILNCCGDFIKHTGELDFQITKRIYPPRRIDFFQLLLLHLLQKPKKVQILYVMADILVSFFI